MALKYTQHTRCSACEAYMARTFPDGIPAHAWGDDGHGHAFGSRICDLIARGALIG